MDVQTIAQMLEGFLAADGNVRRSAESTFNSLKATAPDHLAQTLLTVLQSGAPAQRQQAAITFRNLFRDFFLGNPENAWAMISADTRNVIKTQLLLIAASEQDSSVRRAVGDLIADLGRVLLDNEEWPELPQHISAMINNGDVNVQVLGLNICAELMPNLREYLGQSIGAMAELLKHRLSQDNADMKVAAISLVVQYVSNEARSKWKVFEEFVPPIMTITQQMSVADEGQCAEILQRLIEAAELSSEWFKPHLGTVVSVSLQMANNADLDDSLRQFSAEFLLTIVEAKPKMASKCPGFIDNLIDTLMRFMLDTEDDAAWMDRELTADNEDETRNFDVGEAGLDRVARAVGGDVALPLIFARVGEFLKQSDWHHKVAGIVAISQTIEYMPEDKVEADLAQVVDLLLQQTAADHHRVRFAALRALGQVALDHQPHVQMAYHQVVLPAFIRCFDDPVARVQTQAFAAFVNFAEEVECDDLLPYVQDVMSKIMVRLGDNFHAASDVNMSPESIAKQHRGIREQCITCVAVISGVLGEKFTPWIGTIVPLMKHLVEICVNQQDRQLRGRALECLSIIVYSVGVKALQNDIQGIVNALIQLYQIPMPADDPVKEYVFEGLQRLMKCLGKAAGPYVHEILPPMLKSFNVPEEQINPEEGSEVDYTLICLSSGGYSGVKTSLLTDIELQLQLLTSVVEGMEGAFGPYVQQTVNAVAPLLKLKYSDSVQRLALIAMSHLFAAGRDGGIAPAQLQSWMLEVMQTIFEAVSDEDEVTLRGVEHLIANAGGLAQCITGAGPGVLTGPHVETICKKVFELIEKSSKRRAHLEEMKQGADCDEEDRDQCDEEAGREQIFRETLLQVLEYLMSTHPQLFCQHAAALCLEFVNTMIVPTRNSADRALAVYVCCDILEKLGPDGIVFLGNTLPQIVMMIRDPSPHVRQACAFAVSVAVKLANCEPAVVIEAAKALYGMLEAPNAWDRDSREASDNAVSALLNIVTHRSNLFEANVLQGFADLIIKNQPLKSDIEEMSKVNEQLTLLLDESLDNIFWGGPERRNLPFIMRFFGGVYKTSTTNAVIDRRIVDIVRKLGGPQIVAQRMGGIKLSQVETNGLNKIGRDATAAATAQPAF